MQHDRWARVVLFTAGTFAALALCGGAAALAQGGAAVAPGGTGMMGQVVPGGNPADTFPASLGYLALTVIGTAGAAMSAVIGKLWYGLADRDRLLAEQGRANQAAIDAVKKEHAEEIADLRNRLDKEQTERLKDAERLLREQKDILREVMVTCGSITQAIEHNTKMLEKVMAPK